MSKHTPGPWHWSGDSLTHRQFDIYSPSNAPSQHVCTVNNLSVEKLWQRDAAQAQANAHLIAAAPDLLDVVKEVNAELERLNDFRGFVSMRQMRIMEKARTAIAKATGGESCA